MMMMMMTTDDDDDDDDDVQNPTLQSELHYTDSKNISLLHDFFSSLPYMRHMMLY